MRKRTRCILLVGCVALLCIGQEQCNIEWPEPPFDTTGTYIGTWSGQTNEPEKAQQTVAACPLTMTLVQDLTADYPADHGVSGTVEIDFSCIELPEWAEPIPPNTVNVTGLLQDDGKLTLLSGGCTTALCLVLALDGQGVDVDGDGAMDVYEGDWSFTILLAGVQPFGVAGTFEVASVDV